MWLCQRLCSRGTEVWLRGSEWLCGEGADVCGSGREVRRRGGLCSSRSQVRVRGSGSEVRMCSSSC
jgi:hypothetical protein